MAKSLARLEREYAQYIVKTKEEAERKRRLIRKPPKVRYTVQTKHVTTGVGGKAIWGKVKTWRQYADIKLNIKAARDYAVAYMNRRHIGTVLYIRREGTRGATPIFQAKWGHDNLPFVRWNGPVGEYWKRQLRK